MQVIYAVQPFRAGPEGLKPGRAVLRGQEGEARRLAEGLALEYEAVIAWRQERDEDVGYYSEPAIFLQLGMAPGAQALHNHYYQ
jgi:hypothetical protein